MSEMKLLMENWQKYTSRVNENDDPSNNEILDFFKKYNLNKTEAAFVLKNLLSGIEDLQEVKSSWIDKLKGIVRSKDPEADTNDLDSEVKAFEKQTADKLSRRKFMAKALAAMATLGVASLGVGGAKYVSDRRAEVEIAKKEKEKEKCRGLMCLRSPNDENKINAAEYLRENYKKFKWQRAPTGPSVFGEPRIFVDPENISDDTLIRELDTTVKELRGYFTEGGEGTPDSFEGWVRYLYGSEAIWAISDKQYSSFVRHPEVNLPMMPLSWSIAWGHYRDLVKNLLKALGRLVTNEDLANTVKNAGYDDQDQYLQDVRDAMIQTRLAPNRADADNKLLGILNKNN